METKLESFLAPKAAAGSIKNSLLKPLPFESEFGFLIQSLVESELNKLDF